VRVGAVLESLAGALGGPIFTRELRVASRKGRTYWLRFLYVVVLAVVLVMALGRTAFSGNAAFGTAQAATVATALAHVITWCNFVVAQLVAVSLLGSVMSDEARQRTLGTVLTTPLGARRFVTGMLLGRLVQPLFIIALSFPCIALLRVFGGIPWQFVGAGVSITITTTLFAGALALWLSVCSRRAVSVSGTAGGLMVLVHIGPEIAAMLAAFAGEPFSGATEILFIASPAVVLGMNSSGVVWGAGTPSALLLWPLHCALALGATAVLLALAAGKFRARALRHVFPAPKRTTGSFDASLRPVRGNALVWKDVVVGRRLSEQILVVALLASSLLAMALVPWSHEGTTWGISLLVLFALTVTAVLVPGLQAAECITREKEGRTWPVVLMLPFTDGEIIRWKLRALVRRNRALWLALVPALAALLAIGSRLNGGDFSDGKAALWFFLLTPRLASVSFLGLSLGLWSSATDATSRKARLGTLLLSLLLPAVGQIVIVTSFSAIDHWCNWPPPPAFITYGVLVFMPMLLEIGLGLLFLERASRRVRRAHV
jgi:hypothetical protein